MLFDVISYTQAKKTERQFKELLKKHQEAELKLKEAELRIKKTRRKGILLSIITLIVGLILGKLL